MSIIDELLADPDFPRFEHFARQSRVKGPTYYGSVSAADLAGRKRISIHQDRKINIPASKVVTHPAPTIDGLPDIALTLRSESFSGLGRCDGCGEWVSTYCYNHHTRRQLCWNCREKGA